MVCFLPDLPGDRYALNTDGTATLYTLGVTNVTMADAGKYRCQGQDAFTVDAYAHGIVLGEFHAVC